MVRSLSALTALALLLAACSSAPTYRTLPAETSPAAAPGRTAQTGAPTATAASAYLTIALTDVRTGERFTLASLKGKLVIVEGMAAW